MASNLPFLVDICCGEDLPDNTLVMNRPDEGLRKDLESVKYTILHDPSLA